MDSEDSCEDAKGRGSSSGGGDSSPDFKGSQGEAAPRSPSYTPQSPSSTPQSPDSYAAFLETQRNPVTPPFIPSPSYTHPDHRHIETEGRSPLSNICQRYNAKSPEPPASPNPPASPVLLPGCRSPDFRPRSVALCDETSCQIWSPRSESRSRQDSLSPTASRGSDKFDRTSGQGSRERAVSESSNSSRDSTPERRPLVKDPPTEEVSDGEMESDHENEKSEIKSMSEGVPSPKSEKRASESNVNMSHEDLSDVSDLDSMGPPSEEEHRSVKKSPIRAPDQSDSGESPPKTEAKLNGNVNAKNAPISPPNTTNGGSAVDIPRMDKIPQEKTSKTEDVEEQLDFEAEEGECVEAPSPAKANTNNADSANKDDDEGSGAASSLEEGEVSDEEERRPEETEPRPVCRFYSRGQCTWGVSCRFLHPGVTDKGNYTMFDMVRAMPAGYSHSGGGHHLPAHHHQHIPVMHAPPRLPPTESPWERGLRTAKEMLRKASKRKEQDSDFEEKKMHLSLAGSGGVAGVGVRSGSPLLEEEEGDLALYATFPPSTSQPASPPPSHTMPLTHIKREREREREDYYRQLDRRAAYEEAASRAAYAPRERSSRYRTTSGALPPSPPPSSARHRQAPPHYMEQDVHERAPPAAAQSTHKSRRGRTTREVIVQRAARGDEWADPWMRGGGDRGIGGQVISREERPGKKGRNYSSATSYSSSSSRSSSSKRSGSPGRNVVRRGIHSPMKQRLAALSPSVIVQERRAATARALAMNPPAPSSSSRKRAPSPAAARQHAANPPPPQHAKTDAFGRPKSGKPKQRTKKHYSKSSTSGSDSSSSSSDSESDSRSSSSSSSSSLRRAGAAGGPTGRGPPMHHPHAHLPTNPNDRKHRQDVKAAGGQPPLRSGQPTAQKKDLIDSDMRKEISLSKKRAPTSPINSMIPPKKPASRREELLKQLKAVEDAIARKRSKI